MTKTNRMTKIQIKNAEYECLTTDKTEVPAFKFMLNKKHGTVENLGQHPSHCQFKLRTLADMHAALFVEHSLYLYVKG